MVGPTWRIGTSFSAARVEAVALTETTYWVSPILACPEGKVRLWALTAVTTSLGVSPRARSASGSR